MNRPLIGQVLHRMGKISALDIDEILVEQAVIHHRFGEIALAWGLCEPEHLCEAWCSQFIERSQSMDLAALGVEGHATACLPAELARRLHVVPLRNIANQLVLATARTLTSHETAQIMRAAGKDIRIVKADAHQIEQVIDAYYPMQPAAA